MPRPVDFDARNDNRLNHFLNLSREAMRGYCLPNSVGDIPDYDTGVIIVIIIYFIAKEYKISKTKLNGYIVLLDMKAQEETGEHLFNLSTNSSGLIRDFNLIIEHMINLKLIGPRAGHSFNLMNNILNIKNFPAMLSDIRAWLDEIVNDYIYMTAKQLVDLIRSRRPNPPTQSRPGSKKFNDAVINANKAIRQKVIDFERGCGA